MVAHVLIQLIAPERIIRLDQDGEISIVSLGLPARLHAAET